MTCDPVLAERRPKDTLEHLKETRTRTGREVRQRDRVGKGSSDVNKTILFKCFARDW